MRKNWYTQRSVVIFCLSMKGASMLKLLKMFENIRFVGICVYKMCLMYCTICVNIRLSVHLSVCQPLPLLLHCPPVCLFVCEFLFVGMYIFTYVFMYLCLSVYLHFCPPAFLPACLPALLSACLSACLAACQPTCLLACLNSCRIMEISISNFARSCFWVW
jgi:hypothetical protein